MIREKMMQKAIVSKIPGSQTPLTTPADPNKQTLEAYNQYAYEYIRNTAPTVEESPPAMRHWIDIALKKIDKEDVIFEIGSAILRDSSYMRSQGYKVICSDAAMSFIRIMNTQGEKAVFFNVLEDKLIDKYKMIFANGVFPHFTSEETLTALRNIRSALTDDGILAFSVKLGEGEEWIEEKIEYRRFAHYWSLDGIRDTLRQEGFEILFNSSNTGAYPSHHWLNIIAKPSK